MERQVLSDAQRRLLNRSPALVSMEQLGQLYDSLYPHMVGDFVHREDLRAALALIDAQLLLLKKFMTLHTHLSAAPGSPTTVPVGLQAPPVGGVAPQLNPAFAVSLIVPGGQPTGGGIAVYPKRINPRPIATPPLSLVEFL